MKKKVALILAIVMLISSLLAIHAQAANVKNFTDVKPDDWYYPAVEYAASHNLFNGTSPSKFSPSVTMTRGMFVTVLGNLNGIGSSYGQDRSSPFADVAKDAWYYPATVWANDNNVVNGTSPTNFNPNGSITREQMATILYRYYNKFGTVDLAEKSSPFYSFPDYGTVSDFARTAMDWAVTYGIINGNGNKLDPRGYATRAQVAQVLMNFSKIDKYAKPSGTPAPSTEPTIEPSADPSTAPDSTPVPDETPSAEPTVTPSAAPNATPVPTTELTWKDFPNRPKDYLRSLDEKGYDNLTPQEKADYDMWRKVIDEWWEVAFTYEGEYDIPTGQSEVDEDGGYYDYDLSNEIARQINEIRVEYGKKPLKYNPHMQDFADIRAKECSVVYDHTRPDGSPCTTVGEVQAENIAGLADYIGLLDYSVEDAARVYVEGWFNSSGHRQNILSDTLRTAAVSCYVTPSGFVYASHDFTTVTQFTLDWELYYD